MSDTKKVVILIVEGSSDEAALSELMERYFQKLKIFVCVIGGDITSDFDSNQGNICGKIKKKIQQIEIQRHFADDDIKQIIHIVDTDGAFIPTRCIVEDKSLDKGIKYESDRIVAKNKHSVTERNSRKAENINMLLNSKVINKIAYNVFFMSRNLEHALYNIIDEVSSESKCDLADEFAERYADDIDGFIHLMNDIFPINNTDLGGSWEYIKKDTNSLKRGSNLAVIFNEDFI